MSAIREIYRSLKIKWFLRRIKQSKNYGKPMPGISRFSFDQTVFLGYDPIDLDLLHFYRETKNEPKDGFITGFFGVRTRVTSLPQSIRPLSGKVLGIPWPNDYLAEAAEWIAMIKSVHEAETTFNMMELGAGWGPWLIEGAFSARKKGIENIYLVGVEADNSHFRTMEQHFRDNEFNPEDHTLLHGAAGTEDSVANWPVAEDSAEAWGHRPVRSSAADKEQDMHHLQDTIGKHPMQEIEVFDVKKLLRRKDTWNLLHIDIQGWETDIVADAISEIGERVQRLVIGTHSRRIEAELLEIMHREKWMLEAEKPCLFNYYNHHSNFESMTYVDGFQCWINPRFSEK